MHMASRGVGSGDDAPLIFFFFLALVDSILRIWISYFFASCINIVIGALTRTRIFLALQITFFFFPFTSLSLHVLYYSTTPFTNSNDTFLGQLIRDSKFDQGL